MTLIYILYGSQTGNAAEIAKITYEMMKERKLTNAEICTSLDDYIKDTNLDNLNTITKLIVVCSTTGNGDVPDNASKFWRKIKSRKLNSNLLKGVSYTVLALGDSNYDQFCHAGKQIFKRLGELGATPFQSLVCVDEVGDMEENVEQWMNTTIKNLEKC